MERKIQLTQGKYAIIDDADFLLVSKYKWHYRSSGRTNGKNGYAKNNKFFMHNLIMKPPKGKQVDHIDRNGLNNVRKNLRICSISQNMHNFPERKRKSKYKGVYYHKRLKNTKPWEVSMTINGKQISLGTFKTEIEAAKTYNKKAKELYKECAILNKV